MDLQKMRINIINSLSIKLFNPLGKLCLRLIKLPHINRKITAQLPGKLLKHLLWIGLTVLVVLNFSFNFVYPRNNYISGIEKNPFQSKVHQELAIYSLSKNLGVAEREFKLAQEYFQNGQNHDQVLGVNTTPLVTWENITAGKANIDKEITVFEKVKEVYPSYLYAPLNLSKLYYQKQDFAKSQTILDRLIKDNPWFAPAQDLQREMKTQ